MHGHERYRNTQEKTKKSYEIEDFLLDSSPKYFSAFLWTMGYVFLAMIMYTYLNAWKSEIHLCFMVIKLSGYAHALSINRNPKKDN